MVHGFQQIVTQAERRYNFVVHGLLPPGDEMAVSLLICRIQPMDSIGGNLSYGYDGGTPGAIVPRPRRVPMAHWDSTGTVLCRPRQPRPTVESWPSAPG